MATAETSTSRATCEATGVSDAGMLYHSIMESVADGIMAVDADRNITAFNPAAEGITGIPRDKAIGRKCFDVLRADACENRCPVLEAMASSEVVANRRVTILNSSGNEVPLSVSAAPLRAGGGSIVGAVETFRDLSGVEKLRKELTHSYTFHDMVGKSAPMRRLFKILPPVAESESTVLLEGESGTGKELFARAIHDLSPRCDGPYIIVNCGALPETLLESELFGYKKGAFTDARKDKPGRFELADGGTIFLDEVETLTLATQTKLLRVIENRTFEPLGGVTPQSANVRVIAATNRPLRDLVGEGKFRDDLYYRLNVVTLELPPLRERRDDVPLLIDHFVDYFNILKGKDIAGVSSEVADAILRHSFPGNVRELQNIIEHGFVLCEAGRIELRHLPRFVTGDSIGDQPDGAAEEMPSSGPGALGEAEAHAIRSALASNGNHRKRTASELGISPTTLWRKMKRYGISS